MQVSISGNIDLPRYVYSLLAMQICDIDIYMCVSRYLNYMYHSFVWVWVDLPIGGHQGGKT